MQTNFFQPQSLHDALALLEQYRQGATVVNGGTDIVEQIAKETITPQAIVSIGQLQELRQIEETATHLIVGGAVTYQQILSSVACRQFPGLAAAVQEVGSPPVRAVATLAGNICTAAPAPDGCVMAMGLGAQLLLASSSGERSLPLCEALLARGKTALQKNELLKAILIPKANCHSAYIRLARRKGQDIAKILIGVSLVVENGLCQKATIALGALNAVPLRAYSLEALLQGRPFEAAVSSLEGIFPTEARPRESRYKQYKEQVLTPMVIRALHSAYSTYHSNLTNE